MSAIPQTQKAWIIERRGRPETALKLRNDWPVSSELKPGQVLVKVQAAALNPVGYKVMRLAPNFLAKRPLPAEHDFSGTIADGGDTEFKAGDQVFGYVSAELAPKTKQGALCEYVRLPADHIVLRPDNVSPIEAAGITLTAQTAYEGMFDVGKLEAGQTILVNGGSSAVGAFAIQLAKAKGAKVVATASTRNLEYVKKLGADEVIDYTKEPLHEYLSKNPPSPKFHVIYDAVALIDPSLFTHSPAYLAPNGIFVTTGPMPKDLSAHQLWLTLKTGFCALLLPSWLGGTKRKYKLRNLFYIVYYLLNNSRIHLVQNNKKRLQEIQEMIANGTVKPHVDSVYEFNDVLKAYERMMSSRATGKIVVKVDPTVS